MDIRFYDLDHEKYHVQHNGITYIYTRLNKEQDFYEVEMYNIIPVFQLLGRLYFTMPLKEYTKHQRVDIVKKLIELHVTYGII